MKRFVLAGNNAAALAALELLLEQVEPSHLLVITPHETQPDWHADLGEAARGRGVRTESPTNINSAESVEMIQAFQPHRFLSVYYNQLFDDGLIGALESPAINFHPSLLPLHRGVSPIVWSVAQGDAVTGLTVHLVDNGIDTGDVLYQLPLPIHPDDTGFEVHAKMVNLVRGTAADLFRRLLSDSDLPTPRQQGGRSSYHGLRDPRLNHLDWFEPSETIRNVVRALADPLPGAHSDVRDLRLFIDRVSLASEESSSRGPAGLVETRGMRVPHVWTGDGRLALEQTRVNGVSVSGEQLVAEQIVMSGDFLS